MASKGYDKDSLLPRRDREQGRRDLQAQRASEGKEGHETFAVPQRENQGHPDGFKSSR
jgi:hypothetical protein